MREGAAQELNPKMGVVLPDGLDEAGSRDVAELEMGMRVRQDHMPLIMQLAQMPRVHRDELF